MMDTGDMPWYKYGTKLTESLTAERAVQAAGLNWTVAKKQISEGKGHRPGPGNHMLVREDLWDNSNIGILGPVRANYIPFQNIEAFSLFDPIVQAGAAVYDSAGSWGQGEWVWIMLRMRGDIEVARNDSVAQFLLFGHTANTGHYRMAYLPVRLVCRNSLTESTFHNPAPLATVPNVKPRRFKASAEIALQEIHDHFEELARKFRAMVKIEMNADRLEKYLNDVFDAWTRTKREGKQSTKEIDRDRKACARLFKNGQGNDLPGVRGTLWTAYSAVTEYVDYHKAAPDDWRYLREVWFSTLKASALRVAIEINR